VDFECRKMTKRYLVEEGVPYQTLLTSIVHKYLSGRLVATERRPSNRIAA